MKEYGKEAIKSREVATFFFTEGNTLKQYDIHHRLGRGAAIGMPYIDRKGRVKYRIEFKEYYETDAGTFEPDEWKSLVSQAVAEEGKTELLGQIMDHCRTHCAWLNKDSEIEEYAMECLCGEAYKYWKDFGGKENGS